MSNVLLAATIVVAAVNGWLAWQARRRWLAGEREHDQAIASFLEEQRQKLGDGHPHMEFLRTRLEK